VIRPISAQITTLIRDQSWWIWILSLGLPALNLVTFHSPVWARRAIVVLLAGSLLTACGSSSDDGPSDEELLSTLQTVTTIDPWAALTPIDTAYAQRVIQQLSDIEGEIRQDVFDNHRFTDESKAKEEAIYGDELLSASLEITARDAEELHPRVRLGSVGWRVQVTKVEHATDSCMYVFGMIDDSANQVSKDYTPFEASWGLKRDVTRSTKINPTHWTFVEEIPKRATAGDPCVG
jgi:hypothetical protein